MLSYTWGSVMTVIGMCIALVLMCFGNKPYRFHTLVYFTIGWGWGGINLGPFFIICKDAPLHTKLHESGHAIQNIIFGPLMPFIVGIPSFIRSRQYASKLRQGLAHTLPPYDSAWYEAQATDLGYRYFK